MKGDRVSTLMAADFRHLKDESELGRRALELLRGLFQNLKRARQKNDYGQAIEAVMGLLKWPLPSETETQLWLQHLAFAFDDLKHGRVDPILTPRKIDNRHIDSTATWCAKADVAAAANFLSDIPGMTRKAAAESIAREYPEFRHLAGPGKDLAKSIESWRTEFEKRRIKNKLASENYEVFCRLRFCSQMRPDAIQEFVQQMLWFAMHRARFLETASKGALGFNPETALGG